MRIEDLLPRQGNCIPCDPPIPCNCAANENCIQINRDCNSCSQTQCVPKGNNATGSSGSQGGGVSKGALAGAIVGALIFLGASIVLFLWYRRKIRVRNRLAATRESPKDIPAAAETVLNRPDPIEKPIRPPTETSTVRVYSNSNTTIDLDPESQHTSLQYNQSRRSSNANPFDDATSLQTAGTEGTNVIPIALVPAESQRAATPSGSHESTSTTPVRPARSPDLNLDHVNVSHDSVRGPTNYAFSTRSGISGFTNRNSYQSNASFSSDLLNEAPMIITPSKGAVRQVLGVVKAEVINAPGSLPSSSDSLKPPVASRPVVRSPLASTPFGPADVVAEADAERPIDPFSDEASINAEYGVSPAPTATTFARSSAVRESNTEWIVETPSVPRVLTDDASRPSSMSTQAGSVADIGSATRVHVGLSDRNVTGVSSIPTSPHRTTMGRVINPASFDSRNLQDHTQKMLGQHQARAQAEALDFSRRISSGSAVSGTSILESFPFVPPSPISDRPIRSPPVSPLSKQSFNSTSPSSAAQVQHVINIAPPSPLTQQSFTDDKPQVDKLNSDALPPPPDRRTLGLSTGSQLSTASSGLGSFPFQIDSGDGAALASSPFNNRQRASLDTLALTSDLSSYPLGFDRDSVQVPMPPPHKS